VDRGRAPRRARHQRRRPRGYLVGTATGTPIYPWTNPTQQELNPTLRLFAAPGEYEPLTFTIRPLRALRRAEVTVVPLGPVPAEAVEVRKVRYLKARRNYSDSGLYRIVPDVLDRWSGGPLAADENATFWLTVTCRRIAAGLYRSYSPPAILKRRSCRSNCAPWRRLRKT
jgi:hypothetical protein